MRITDYRVFRVLIERYLPPLSPSSKEHNHGIVSRCIALLRDVSKLKIGQRKSPEEQIVRNQWSGVGEVGYFPSCCKPRYESEARCQN